MSQYPVIAKTKNMSVVSLTDTDRFLLVVQGENFYSADRANMIKNLRLPARLCPLVSGLYGEAMELARQMIGTHDDMDFDPVRLKDETSVLDRGITESNDIVVRVAVRDRNTEEFRHYAVIVYRDTGSQAMTFETMQESGKVFRALAKNVTSI